MLWQAMRSVPSSITRPSLIELNGLIYVAGQYPQTQFWCYDPTRNEWTQKAGFGSNNHTLPHIFKIKQNICTLSSNSGGSKIYDLAMNCWKTVNSSTSNNNFFPLARQDLVWLNKRIMDYSSWNQYCVDQLTLKMSIPALIWLNRLTSRTKLMEYGLPAIPANRL